jgi:rRNA maturation endonuclease Nob1
MPSDRLPRNLNERTGKHYCITCRKEIPAEELLRNDHVCDECGRKAEAPRIPARKPDE